MKKTVFLTGATGSMGSATLTELLERRDRFNIVLLAHDTRHGRKFLRRYRKEPGVKIVWGDLRDYETVLECVTGADFVLHTAALISPAADKNPVAAEQINVGSIRNILRAINAQPNPSAIRLVSVGSVAMTGDRLPPIHWGRVGDPVTPSIDDHYAVSKIEAERLVIESGLQHWVSLRQTFICIPKLLSLLHPILFHQPLNTVFEFVTARDSGLLMANACEESVPEAFWRQVYNIGGGPRCRTNYLDYLNRIFGALGLGQLPQLVERNWFALRNFHCQWYLDSDRLENFLKFRRDGMDEYVKQVVAHSAWPLRFGFGRLVPRWIVKQFVMKPMAKAPEGPLHWIEHNQLEKVAAFFGSKQAWSSIPNWTELIPAPGAARPLDHGFDDSLPDAKIGLPQLQSAAKFRGGHCLVTDFETGNLHSQVGWRCAEGHEFDASAFVVLRAGHWCRECQPPPWAQQQHAKKNAFLAQVASTQK